MYIIRSALRVSTARPPARFIRGRRYPSTPRPRHIHTTRALAQAAKPPPGPGNTSTGENDASKPDAEKAAAEEHTDAAVATDDPELLAQKLQRSRETSRRYSAALRRQQRSNKPQGLPPVHIPDWFLKRRVIRREDVQDHARQRPRPAYLSVSVSDAESGEQATCSIPTSEDVDAAQVLSRLVRGLWKRRLDDHENRKIEKYFNERIALAEKADPIEAAKDTKNSGVDANTAPISTTDGVAPSAGNKPDFSEMERQWMSRLKEAWSRAEPGSEKTEVHDVLLHGLQEDHELFLRDLQELKRLIDRPEKVVVDTAWSPQQKEDALYKKKHARIERWFKKTGGSRGTRRTIASRRISPLVLAEIRATIAASLSALTPSVGDSFPAAKTNLILHSPAAGHEKVVNACIHDIAEDLQCDLIVLTAQDLAQLAGDYLGEGSEPTPRSIRSLGYETYRLSAELHSAVDDLAEGGEEDPDFNPFSLLGSSLGLPLGIRAFQIPLPGGRLTRGSSKPAQFPGLGQYDTNANVNVNALSDNTGRPQSQNEIQLEDMKIATLLEALLDAGEAKQTRGLVGTEETSFSPQSSSEVRFKSPGFFDYSMNSEGTKLELDSALPMVGAGAGISMAVSIESTSQRSHVSQRPKIIYVKDFKELNATHYGGRIIQKLEELVRKRRTTGESIMIVGSTCSRELTPELSSSGVRELQGEGETGFFRTIVVEGESVTSQPTLDDMVALLQAKVKPVELSSTERRKFRSINLSHIREMLRSLDPAAAANIVDMEKGSDLFRTWALIFPESYLKRVLTYDEVHRLALTALGLYVTSPSRQTEGTAHPAAQMSWGHVALAMGLLEASDTVKYTSFDKAGELARKPRNSFENLEGEAGAKLKAKKLQDAKSLQRQQELRQIAANATKHERWLMPGIADADQIKTTFDQVHVPQETIDSIRTITSLSQLRPDAFNYGILATEKLTGALLYGPPGTGKTLLAKAVAKESGSTVLEVSGAQILGKYVGESEKNIAAVFSLAQKLSPCIVFLDEADSIFASRDAMSDRSNHRATLNQFLKEWDGLNDSAVFVMVATNRPFDLDDAVIRRLPRRLLVDLPTQADRKEILRIHLRGEQLDDSVDLEDLAKRTPFYSGSDLKNIAVSAALACVKEENEQAAMAVAKATLETDPPVEADGTSKPPVSSTTNTPDAPSAEPTTITPTSPPKVLHLVRGQSYNFPEKRVLHIRHFDQALQEISASISEDMSSLSAIKKFDEQYGDRKGKKRRKDFGFGVQPERSESAARVRA